ncbi:MAG: ParB/RepB/Spo0J family partition protein [bacterium]|nr:ParB/RepB/Spo0J family partition protein [bacterium]
MSAPKRGLPPRSGMRHDRHFVDELATRMGEGIGRMIPTDSISSAPDQPRSNLGDLSDLVSSISRHGILEPLLVRRRDGGKYELVSGERRFHAALEAGLSEVPCVELEVDDTQALEIALIENLQRKDLDPFEEANGFQTLVDKYEYTHESVAKAVGRSRVTITEALALLTIPTEVQNECRHADIAAKGLLVEIAKAKDPALMRVLLSNLVNEGIDRAELRRRRKLLAEGKDPSQSAEPKIADDQAKTPRDRPFVWRFKHPEQPFSVSLSFRTEAEPETSEVIAALESLIDELKQKTSENKKQ